MTMTMTWCRGWRVALALPIAASLCSASACMVDEGEGELRAMDDEPPLAPIDALMVMSGEDAQDAPHVPAGPSDGLAADQRPVAQLPGFDLGIEVVDGDVVLSWDDMGPGVTYEVYRSELPYFAPGGTNSVKLVEDAGADGFVDVGAGGPGRAFYQVRAHFPAGYFEGSTTVGKKVTPLYKGYTKISQCLINEVDTSEELCAEIGPAAISAHMWDEVTQAWTWWWNGTEGPGLEFDTGDVVSINLDHGHPSHHVAVGYVPADDDVTMDLYPGDNLVTVLPARFGDLMASELLAAVPHATRVGYWDAASQYTLWYPDGPDFPVSACTDVHVEVSQPSQWPPPRPPCPCGESMPVLADLFAGTIATADLCYDEEHFGAANKFVPGTDGIVVGRRYPGTGVHEYELAVGAFTEWQVTSVGLDPSLIGAPACVSYDDRLGNHEFRYRLVSADEAASCEDAVRAAVAAQQDGPYCAGGV